MIKFNKPVPRYDNKLANSGRWFYIEDNAGNDYGGFLCGLFDMSLPRVKIAAERMARIVNARAVGKRGKVDKHRDGVELFVELCLFDWDVNDENGKAVKFSKEVAIEYFNIHEIDEETGEKLYTFDFVFEELFAKAQDAKNYQSVEQVNAGDPLGN